MAQIIYPSEKEIEEILADVKKQLTGSKCFGGVSIKKTYKKDDRNAFIYFTENAWNKMTALVREFDTEVQWHGCVRRVSDEEFEIYDIIVPPHEVTSSTVVSDNEKYTEWLMGLNDETFDNLHFHGHSHVNMSCHPSGTDEKYRQDLVTQLPIPKEGEDSFYIFLIFNKKGEWTGEIYDLKNNALYGTDDIDIDVYCGDEMFLSDFIADAKKQAVNPTPTYTKYTPIKVETEKEKKPETKKGKEEKETEKKDRSYADDFYDRYTKSYGGYYYPYGGYGGYYDDEDDPESPFYVRGN